MKDPAKMTNEELVNAFMEDSDNRMVTGEMARRFVYYSMMEETGKYDTANETWQGQAWRERVG